MSRRPAPRSGLRGPAEPSSGAVLSTVSGPSLPCPQEPARFQVPLPGSTRQSGTSGQAPGLPSHPHPPRASRHEKHCRTPESEGTAGLSLSPGPSKGEAPPGWLNSGHPGSPALCVLEPEPPPSRGHVKPLLVAANISHPVTHHRPALQTRTWVSPASSILTSMAPHLPTDLASARPQLQHTGTVPLRPQWELPEVVESRDPVYAG